MFMSRKFAKYIKATDYLLNNRNNMSEEEEDALLEEMDDLWWSLTEDEIAKVNKYIKSIQNTQKDLELVDVEVSVGESVVPRTKSR